MGCRECREVSESTAGEIISSVTFYAKNLASTARGLDEAQTDITVSPEVLVDSSNQVMEFMTVKNDIPRMNVGKVKEQAAGISDLFKKKGSNLKPTVFCDINKLQSSIMRQIEMNPSSLLED